MWVATLLWPPSVQAIFSSQTERVAQDLPWITHNCAAYKYNPSVGSAAFGRTSRRITPDMVVCTSGVICVNGFSVLAVTTMVDVL